MQSARVLGIGAGIGFGFIVLYPKQPELAYPGCISGIHTILDFRRLLPICQVHIYYMMLLVLALVSSIILLSLNSYIPNSSGISISDSGIISGGPPQLLFLQDQLFHRERIRDAGETKSAMMNP